MGRTLRSPTRKISNRGDYPRFIGTFPCTKGVTKGLPFDSISALLCGVFLEWRPDVARIAFEARGYKFEAVDGLPALECIPDYEVILTTGELEIDEAKYSKKSLSLKNQVKLALNKSHFARIGQPYHVVYRLAIEKNGFIDTVILLRLFGQLSFSPELLRKATDRLALHAPINLEDWRARAHKAGVSIGLLYHLLYHQQLPLLYQPLLPMELLACRA